MLVSRILGRHRPPGHIEETAVHYTISYYLAQARIAGLRQHAQREALARSAGRARPGRRAPAAPGWPDPGRRVRHKPSPWADAEAGGHTEIAALLREHAEQAAPFPQRSGPRKAAAQ